MKEIKISNKAYKELESAFLAEKEREKKLEANYISLDEWKKQQKKLLEESK